MAAEPPCASSSAGAGLHAGDGGTQKRDSAVVHAAQPNSPAVAARAGATPAYAAAPLSPTQIIANARAQAFRGGIAGASAQILNVVCFMWLRTTMNYQYRYGGTTMGAISTLWNQGGVFRFYRGLIPALMQSPLSRFGDTAANVGVLSVLDASEKTNGLPVALKTALASCGAAAWRLVIMPIDAWKTTKQVEGGAGLKILLAKARKHGVVKIYHGSGAAMAATWVGHYPWFFTFNYLQANMPQFDALGPYSKHIRTATIGFCSSVVSDTCSNSIRVLKTTKQTSPEPLSYPAAARGIIAKDGLLGLFGRGLSTRILTNGMQGMVFSVGWKALEQRLKDRASS
eukprot:GHVT01060832.1.p1 GENE.GHVT01060832.1~~GHVT01060832.1.p1  ORF type:complete len:342 (-),score=78.40 GHVT01060832.1:3410-4435(-)